MTTQSNYLYGITRGDAADSASLGALAGLDGGTVRLVRGGEQALVVSRAEVHPFSQLAPEKTLRYLAEHQRVLEGVMKECPVLPVKFGTYAADDAQAAAILESGREQFGQALARYGDKVEMDLVVWWPDLGPVLGELAGDPAVVAIKGRMGGRATTADRVEVGQLVKGLLDRRRGEIAADLTATLAADFSPLVSHAIKDDSMILNVAALVGRGGPQGWFDQAVDTLDRRYKERLSFRRIGPLPPYSFATVEVGMVGEAELDEARHTLGLGEYASLEEMKSAWRRLLREHHPDRNAAAESGGQVERVTAAYGLLERFARNVKHRLFNAGPAGAGLPVVKVCSLAELSARRAGHAA